MRWKSAGLKVASTQFIVQPFRGTEHRPAIAAKRPDIYGALRHLLAARMSGNQTIAQHETKQILLGISDVCGPEMWVELACEAESHGLVPLLEPAISRFATDFPAVMPAEVRRLFAALSSRHRWAACIREKCIDELLAAFASGGIQVILLKGAALAHLIYRTPGLRPMFDVDVLVDRRDLARAAEIAAHFGFSFASNHGSRFAGRMHHLPPASMSVSGLRIVLELHDDAMSPNQPESLTFTSLASEPMQFQRGSGPIGLAFGHIDMLRHLARHTFEPAQQVRLQLLYDLWNYWCRFGNEIDGVELEQRYAHVVVALQLAYNALTIDGKPDDATAHEDANNDPSRIGNGMLPLSQIGKMRLSEAAAALFNPSEWWLHGFYGVPLNASLLYCRAVRHPLTLIHWLTRRSIAAMQDRCSGSWFDVANEEDVPSRCAEGANDTNTEYAMDTIPRQVAGIESDQVGDELLLYRPADRAALYLNATAATICDMCDGRRSVREIICALGERYPDAIDIATEVTGILVQLQQRGMLAFHQSALPPICCKTQAAHEGGAEL
jgi:hypothetical protein